jgi:hypothetical protein
MLPQNVLPAVPIKSREIRPRTGELARASWQQSAETSIGGALWGAMELDEARRWGGMMSRTLSAEESSAWLKDRGITLALDRPHNEHELGILARRARDEQRRQDLMSRASGKGDATAMIAAGFARQIFDPGNIAFALLPIIPPQWKAARLAATTGKFAKFAQRAWMGAVEGGVGNLIGEPIVAMSRRQEHAAYGWGDVALSVGSGAVIGGALHAGGGYIADVLTDRRARQYHRLVASAQETRERRLALIRRMGTRTFDYERPAFDYDIGSIRFDGQVRPATKVDLEAMLEARYEALRAELIEQSKGKAPESEWRPEWFSRMAEGADLDLRRLESRWVRAGLAEKIEILQLDPKPFGDVLAREAKKEALDSVERELAMVKLLQKAVESRRKNLSAQNPRSGGSGVKALEALRLGLKNKATDSSVRELRKLELKEAGLIKRRAELVERKVILDSPLDPQISRLSALPDNLLREVRASIQGQFFTHDHPVKLDGVLDAVEGRGTERLLAEAEEVRQPLPDETRVSQEADAHLASTTDDELENLLQEAKKEVDAIKDFAGMAEDFAEVAEAEEFASKVKAMQKATNLLVACTLKA